MNTIIVNGKAIDSKKEISSFVTDDDYRIIKTNTSHIYLSKMPADIWNSKFWLRIYSDGKYIQKIELRNAEERFKMDYSNMDAKKVEEQFSTNNTILAENYGDSVNKKVGSVEYKLDWGRVVSYMDNKSGDVGIVVLFD